MEKDVDAVLWIIVICSVGVVLGLWLFGHRVMATIGYAAFFFLYFADLLPYTLNRTEITRITPSRGYSIELGTSLAVLLSSFIGLPISSTHCAVGAVTAIGLLNAQGHRSIEWRLLGKVAVSWILTLPTAGLLSAALYAMLRGSLS